MVKRLTLLISFFGFLGLLAGCGGGGGGGSSQVTLTAIADWTNFGQPISGSSMQWSLYSLDEALVRSIAINRDLPGEQSAPMANLPKGAYHLKVELFSQTNLGGSIVGVLDEQIQLNGNSIYRAVIGTDPASVKVTPPSATFKAGQGKQFYAACYNAAQKPTFAVPDSFSWQTFGSVATVNETGFVQGTSAGNGTVVATDSGSSLQGGATITVQNTNVTTSKWTVLIFLNAANDLNEFGDLNFDQMEEVAGNPQVRFVVQWKQFQSSLSPNPSFVGTRRYLAKLDTANGINSELIQNMGTNVDMGRKETLLDFINWGKTFYPAQRYCLVIWNHGNGWRRGPDSNRPTRGVSYDDQTGSSIETWELAQALGSNNIDIIAWDASLMQMAEVAHEIQDQAELIVGSEESPPGAGYPYDLVFAPFRDNPDATTLTLAKSFVDNTLIGYQGTGEFITQSVIDPTQLANLATKVSALAQELINNQASPGFAAMIQQVRNEAARYPRKFLPTNPGDFRKYRDLWDVCDRI
ncbi:MAG: Ig-like domain-containing protein, partial [Chlorobia bacterium]|nr:Ig-like domain-containing protein [Fimbriimonadaceae bacterium]